MIAYLPRIGFKPEPEPGPIEILKLEPDPARTRQLLSGPVGFGLIFLTLV